MVIILPSSNSKKPSKGFTLIELIITISILVILSSIAASVYNGYTKKVKEQVCNVNCMQLERMIAYYTELAKYDNNNELNIEQYINEHGKDICPNNGVITYKDDEIRCSIHTDESDSGSVPYL